MKAPETNLKHLKEVNFLLYGIFEYIQDWILPED